MTFKNRKKLYDTYIERGMTSHAKAIAKGHPDVLDKPVEKEEAPKTKSKGKK